MEQAIISLVSLSVAVTLYLDRGRRADFRQLEGRLEKLDKRFARLEKKLEKRISDSAARTDARINDLNRSVIELAQSVGRTEGRTETLAAVE